MESMKLVGGYSPSIGGDEVSKLEILRKVTLQKCEGTTGETGCPVGVSSASAIYTRNVRINSLGKMSNSDSDGIPRLEVGPDVSV